MNTNILGFNGERVDPACGYSHLGNGYRACNPVVMRFHSPDSMSPFGAGGINSYAYCAGNPVNLADPTGHHSVGGWLGIGIGVVLGMLLTPVSGGSSLAVALAVVSVATEVVSTGLAVTQQFVEESAPKAAACLGWAALGAGILSGLSSVALSRVVPGAKSLVSLFKGTGNRPFGGLMLTGEDARAALQGAAPAVPRDSIERLPDDLISLMSRNMPGRTLAVFSATSQRMRDVVTRGPFAWHFLDDPARLLTLARPSRPVLMGPFPNVQMPVMHQTTTALAIAAGEYPGILPSEILGSGVGRNIFGDAFFGILRHPQSLSRTRIITRELQNNGLYDSFSAMYGRWHLYENYRGAQIWSENMNFSHRFID